MDFKSAKELALMQHVTGHLDRIIGNIAKELNCSFADAEKFRSQIRQEDAEKEGRCYH
jgi:hypothetical protein